MSTSIVKKESQELVLVQQNLDQLNGLYKDLTFVEAGDQHSVYKRLVTILSTIQMESFDSMRPIEIKDHNYTNLTELFKKLSLGPLREMRTSGQSGEYSLLYRGVVIAQPIRPEFVFFGTTTDPTSDQQEEVEAHLTVRDRELTAVQVLRSIFMPALSAYKCLITANYQQTLLQLVPLHPLVRLIIDYINLEDDEYGTASNLEVYESMDPQKWGGPLIDYQEQP